MKQQIMDEQIETSNQICGTQDSTYDSLNLKLSPTTASQQRRLIETFVVDSCLNVDMIQTNQNQTIVPSSDLYPYRMKIDFPGNAPKNLVGLILGPRGIYQKKLEEESGCKILIRGGNPSKNALSFLYDEQEPHIILLSDTQTKLPRGKQIIESIIYADELTKQQIRSEQLRMAQSQQAQTSVRMQPLSQDHLVTPYGAPSPTAYILAVPNECVGLIIGKGGDTIKQLQLKTGVKISVAKSIIPDTNQRNVFIEGSLQKYDLAKSMIDQIIDEYLVGGQRQAKIKEDPNEAGETQLQKTDFNQSKDILQFMGLDESVKQPTAQSLAFQYQQQYFIPQQNDALRSQQTFQQQVELQLQLEKQLEINPFPGPHTFVSIPNAATAFIIGYNGERIRKLHQLTGAYIFIPKDYNTLTDERLIQLSGNDKSVEFCKREIKYIVQQVAPLLNINLDEFKRSKRNIKENFKLILQQKGALNRLKEGENIPHLLNQAIVLTNQEPSSSQETTIFTKEFCRPIQKSECEDVLMC